MANPVARKGDLDSLGYSISTEVSENVRVNRIPVAMKGSLMNDGIAIVGEVSNTVKVNGRQVALIGSTTEYHPNDPKGVATIIQGSENVRVGK